MSSLLDETAADVPVRDNAANMSRLTAAAPDPLVYLHDRTRQDISRMSREELEDRYLRLNEETLQLKQHIHRQDEKIKKLGTKLMRLVKDRGRMEQLVAGGAQPAPRVRDVEMEEMMEELQEKVRGQEAENERLKQRLLVAKQQLISTQSRRQTPHGHVHSRINSGTKKLRDDTSSPSPMRPRSLRSLDGGARPPTGQLPRYGHSLLEEARAEIRNRENVIESQRSHVEELEGALELLREELRKREVEYEERLLQVRQEQNSTVRSHVNSNVSMIKQQKQLADRSNTLTELGGRFLQLQEAQQTLKASHDAAMTRVDMMSAQLKDERLKSLELERRLQGMNITKAQMEQLQDRISELEQENDLLRDNNKNLLNSAFDVSQQQKWQLQEQQLKLQITQLETALKADLVDKNEILDKIKAERENNERLTEENTKLQFQFLEQKQQLEELNNRLKFYSREGEYNVAELTEALLLIKKRKSQRSGDLGFLADVEEASSSTESAVREMRAAHAETIQELEKTRHLLNTESQISRDYKAELEAVLEKMKSNKVEYEQKLERQAQVLDARAAKISRLEAQFRDVAYSTKTYVFKPDPAGEDEADKFEETFHLERGENLLELQIVGATLSPPALQAMGDAEPSTFCTYSFYLFEPHSTPVVMGHSPKYGFTSRYTVSMDDRFLDYLHRCSVTVELHQASGLEWRTLARGQLRLQRLLEQDGKLHGSVPLVGTREEVRSFGSVDFWLRLRVPVTETLRRYREKRKAEGFVHAALSEHTQPTSSSWNELLITVRRCTDLQSRSSPQPSPYVVYKFFSFPDCPTATVHDRCDPEFHDLKSYSVLMDADLDRYLRCEELQLYVFDAKEEQMDAYLGKARVPLLSLASEQVISGVFELADHSGLPSGSIEVTLRWKLTYLPSAGSIMAADEAAFIPEEKAAEDPAETPLRSIRETPVEKADAAGVSTAPLPKLRKQRTQERDGAAAKRVTFIESTAADRRFEDRSLAASPAVSAEKRATLPPAVKVTSKALRSASEDEEDEEESHVSEGQLIPSAQSYSDDSDISEEIVEDVEEAPAAADDPRESAQSDSDDCIVQGPAAERKPSERLRVEVVSLSLRPQSRPAQDDSVVRLFVEYSVLDLPTEETPVSLPKPQQGRSINYNYSKVIPVDAENNAARRRLLRGVLQGRNPQMERIRFTVVSEPPEAEEQERECEDVGVAFLRIPEILETRRDLTEASLNVLDVDDGSDVVGSLTVTLEGLEALRAIMEDQDLE
ncbi:protein fantom isoform 2-T4 [Odontesthes bonariensis]|uniref:protein fantom n=1 Tax=Odontesthes bonariensis TaxID=219752 RepID=UPI003F5834CC